MHDMQTDFGSTALHHASEAGHLDVAKLLRIADARVDLLTRAGETALSLASRNGHREIMRLLGKPG